MIILNSGVGQYVKSGNRTFSYFGGNNYLGLAGHPEVKKQAIAGIEKYGVNFAASRQTTGTADIHTELERRLAFFKGKQAALVFASGYMGDGMLLDALRERYHAVFADESAHPSITDGIPRTSPLFRYKHADPQHLEKLIKESHSGPPLIITDGIFALTGEIAPLKDLHFLAEKFGGTLIVDDAHATGILGESGRGTPEYFHLDTSPALFQAETMSKALGVYGGFIASDEDFIRKMAGHSRVFSGSTSLPPPLAAAGISAVNLFLRSPGLRNDLVHNTKLIREGVRGIGYETSADETPIIPLFFSSGESARQLSLYLQEHGIIAPFVDYPVKTEKYIVRIAASAVHTHEQIRGLLETLKNWREKHDLNEH